MDADLQYLHMLSKDLKREEFRNNIEEQTLASVAERIKGYDLSPGETNYKCVVKSLTECLRCLRNSCVSCARNQQLLGSMPGLVTCVCQKVKTSYLQDIIPTARCGIQFLGNLAAGNEENKASIFRDIIPHVSSLTLSHDSCLVDYTYMLLHTCMHKNNKHINILQTNTDLANITVGILNSLKEDNCKWGMYLLEDILSCGESLAIIYSVLDATQRLLTLEVVLNLLETHNQEKCVSNENIKVIGEQFKKEFSSILSLSQNSEEQEPLVTLKLLEVLCIASSNHEIYGQLQDDIELLESAINLLHSIHLIGKSENNVFSSKSKLTAASSLEPNHPSLGLKKDIIRLVGNLVYRNKTNQDKVREMEGIPLILDHTAMDGRNPYITQWSIFAIHNLLEDNPENKAVIGLLKQQGLANNIEALKEHGVEAKLIGDKIHVKPLPKDES